MIKIIRNKNDNKIHILLNVFIKYTKGIKRVISISKIRKINLIRKNWILNGIRDLDIGSKPHSKGDIFSRFLNSFMEIKKFKIKISSLIIISKSIKKIKNMIIYIKYYFLNFLIGN